ncbi:hypothetical protein Fmac_030829 [Flemingia macrophylla]|uniref:Uncharacterized protein n=1 Tax=Flemingia macrophylla TaxID=520843 RepID=A0ABD1L0Q7_9FABA
MEWCSHCCRLCPTRLETIHGDISVASCVVCTLCGKVLLDLNESLQVIFPNRISYRRKRTRNIKNDQKKESDTKNFEEA